MECDDDLFMKLFFPILQDRKNKLKEYYELILYFRQILIALNFRYLLSRTKYNHHHHCNQDHDQQI